MTGAPKGAWISPGARVSIVVLFVLMCGLAAGNLLFTRSQVDAVHAQQAQLRAEQAQLRAQQLAGCGFARDLGSVPIPDKPRPGKLGVSLVTDSRAQWRALHCPGTLPVPPGLAHWAAYFHLPVN